MTSHPSRSIHVRPRPHAFKEIVSTLSRFLNQAEPETLVGSLATSWQDHKTLDFPAPICLAPEQLSIWVIEDLKVKMSKCLLKDCAKLELHILHPRFWTIISNLSLSWQPKRNTLWSDSSGKSSGKSHRNSNIPDVWWFQLPSSCVCNFARICQNMPKSYPNLPVILAISPLLGESSSLMWNRSAIQMKDMILCGEAQRRILGIFEHFLKIFFERKNPKLGTNHLQTVSRCLGSPQWGRWPRWLLAPVAVAREGSKLTEISKQNSLSQFAFTMQIPQISANSLCRDLWVDKDEIFQALVLRCKKYQIPQVPSKTPKHSHVELSLSRCDTESQIFVLCLL